MWNEESLEENFDIIIEDGLHTFEANVCFFENSIHKLKQNGYFIIEDIRVIDDELFKEKIKEWELKFSNYLFTFLKIESNNVYDNTLIIIKRLY